MSYIFMITHQSASHMTAFILDVRSKLHFLQSTCVDLCIYLNMCVLYKIYAQSDGGESMWDTTSEWLAGNISKVDSLPSGEGGDS